MHNLETKDKEDFFRDLVNSHLQEMIRYTISKVSSSDEAEDIVQEAFLDAYKSYENFQGRSSIKTWLFAILKNKIMDYHRKRFKTLLESENDLITIENKPVFFDDNGSWKKQFQPQDWPEETNSAELLNYLKICMRKLPLHLLSAVQLKYYDELSAEKICKELEISKTNYWQMLHRARLYLRDCIEKNLINSGNKL